MSDAELVKELDTVEELKEDVADEFVIADVLVVSGSSLYVLLSLTRCWSVIIANRSPSSP